jgi:hypothetical protein
MPPIEISEFIATRSVVDCARKQIAAKTGEKSEAAPADRLSLGGKGRHGIVEARKQTIGGSLDSGRGPVRKMSGEIV